jgi:hypothetical protein
LTGADAPGLFPDMTTYETPADLIARLPKGTNPRWATYTPTTKAMSTDLWDRWRVTLLALLADTEPPSDGDARIVLGVMCRFVGWVIPLYQYQELTEMFAIERIEEYLSYRAKSLSGDTHSHDRSRLMRCHRVLRGEPATTRRKARAPGADPYPYSEIEALLEAAAGSADLTRVLAVALTTGQSCTDAIGRSLPTHGEFAAAVQHLGHHGIRIHTQALDGGVLTDSDWALARRAAQRVGLDIEPARLRMTWLLPVANHRASLAQIVTEHRVSRRDLDNAMGHCPTPDADVRALLRG